MQTKMRDNFHCLALKGNPFIFEFKLPEPPKS